MRIITDSAADFTGEELISNDIHCVQTAIMFGTQTYTADTLPDEEFWTRMMAGENAKTSQPSPDAFLKEFEAAKEAGEEAVCICVSSGVSGTIQSAKIAASLVDYDRIHIVDSLTGAAAQKLLVLHACRLRDEGRLIAADIASRLESLRSRIRLLASLDTLEYLARGGRIPKAVANIGGLAQLKPLIHVTPEGKISLCGKAFGRHRAIDALAKKIASYKIDSEHPILPIYSFKPDNCLALIKKLGKLGVCVDDQLLSAVGTSIAPHIGPGVFGVGFVEAE